jgi:hypothetical protein
MPLSGPAAVCAAPYLSPKSLEISVHLLPYWAWYSTSCWSSSADHSQVLAFMER